MRILRDLLANQFASVGTLRGKLASPVSSAVATPRPLMRRTPVGPEPGPAQAMLQIACPDPTAEDSLRDHHISVAQRLVRQERWEDLMPLIKRADATAQMTPGAMPVADLLAYGARADVVLAVEHALLGGKPDRDAPLLAGIEALEHVLADHEDSALVAAIVAQAHIDIGWSWRGTGWDVEIPDRNRDAFSAHFDRAADILAPFEDMNLRSPLLAATQCALLGGLHAGHRKTADRYEALIDLNPSNPRPMRAMGTHLLPRWYGCHEELELEARRTAARTLDLWGAGAYTWVMFDAIVMDDAACAALDLPFFTEGLRDILQRRQDAYTANLLAAYCANAIGLTFSGNDKADQNRACIAENATWIVREHLTELHPMIWAHAAQGFDNNLPIQSPSRFAARGREDAQRIITGLFSREIAAGHRIVFTDEGPEAILG